MLVKLKKLAKNSVESAGKNDVFTNKKTLKKSSKFVNQKFTKIEFGLKIKNSIKHKK